MNEKHIFGDIIRLPRPFGCALSSGTLTVRGELIGQLQDHMRALGPSPKRCLETFADLGLSDAEIGRYFRIPHKLVTQLRESWKIGGTV